MSRDVLVALLVTVVLGHVVEVVTADDDGALHLGGDDDTSQDTALDVDLTDEGALLVNVSAVNGLSGSLEAVADILDPTLVLGLAELVGLEDVGLLLVSLLGLNKEWSVNIFLLLELKWLGQCKHILGDPLLTNKAGGRGGSTGLPPLKILI